MFVLGSTFLGPMIFIVALYLPWCGYLESFLVVKPQLCAENLKRFWSDDDLLDAARFTIKLVGQTLVLGKCVLLGVSWVVRGVMKD